jgi:hypothetical protein
MYIVGDFGVVSQSGYTYGERKAVFTDGPFVLVDQPTSLTSGIFTEQGLCFFAGKLRISQSFTAKKGQQVKLLTGRLDTPLYKVYINDKPAALLPWSPFETDITPFIHEGENTLTLELFASNRNLLGPHHFIKGESHHVGPSTFTSTPDSWVDGDIVGSNWRGDDYCFVAFGIPEN